MMLGLIRASVHHFRNDDRAMKPNDRRLLQSLSNEDYAAQFGIDGPIHDIVIAGAGPGGLTAALFGARAGLDVLVLGSETGLLSETQHLDNFPSYSGGGGPNWLTATKQQAYQFGARFATAGVLATALSRETESGLYTLTTTAQNPEERTLHAWSVIVASGATPRRLGLPMEDLMWGLSMHNCAICDGHLYLDRTVMVVGGGDSAMDAAILLARYARQVYLVHRQAQFSGKNKVAIDVVHTTSNINVLSPYQVVEWELDSQNQLKGAKIQQTESHMVDVLSADGVFVMIGATPNTHWLSGAVELEAGFVKLDGATQTTASGIFAVGEVSDNVYKQAITASAEGAQAAIDAERWLRETRGVHKHLHLQPPQPPQPGVIVKMEKAGDHEADGDIACDLVKEECIKQLVEKNAVVVFSKSWCPYCRKALEALGAAGITQPHIVDLTDNGKAHEIQATLQSMTGRRTVPNVFVGGKSIGGGDETSRFQAEGKLIPLLIDAGAIKPLKPSGIDERQIKSCNLAERSCVEETIHTYPVLMFTLSWCPECKRTLEFLSSIIGPRSPHLIDLDDYDKEIQLKIRNNMMEVSGRRSVPNLYIGGEFFGGYAQTLRMHEAGQVVAKLQEVGWYIKEQVVEEEM